MTGLVHQHQRVLDQPPERLEEPGAEGAVHYPVVAAHGDPHSLAMDELAVDYDGFFFERADREDADLGRIDDRRELVDAEHAEVRDGERGARVLLWLELPLAGALRELACLTGDLAHALAVGVEDDRGDEPFLDGDRHPDMNAIEVADLVAEPMRVDLGVLGEGGRDGLQDDVVERDLELITHG